MADLTVSSAVDTFMAAANQAAMLAALNITLGGAFATSGSFALTLSITGATNVTLPTSGTLAILGANTFTGAQIVSVNGAASTPALHGSGTIFTGGTATTTKPYWLIEPSGLTSTGWDTGGTGLGINMPSGHAGPGLDIQLNGATRWKFTFDPNNGLVCGSTSILTPNYSGPGRMLLLNGNGGVYFDGSSNIALGSGAQFAWGNTANPATLSAYSLGLKMSSAAVLKVTDGSTGYGTIDAAAFKVAGVAGTSGTITAASTVTVVNGIVTVIA